jgi:hypothetical protein
LIEIVESSWQRHILLRCEVQFSIRDVPGCVPRPKDKAHETAQVHHCSRPSHGRSPRAQQSGMLVVAHLSVGMPDANAGQVAALSKGLSETGCAEGQNVLVEYH